MSENKEVDGKSVSNEMEGLPPHKQILLLFQPQHVSSQTGHLQVICEGLLVKLGRSTTYLCCRERQNYDTTLLRTVSLGILPRIAMLRTSAANCYTFFYCSSLKNVISSLCRIRDVTSDINTVDVILCCVARATAHLTKL